MSSDIIHDLIIALVTAVPMSIPATLGYMATRKVHTVVNGRFSIVVDRVTQLTESLTEAGVIVPPPNKPDEIPRPS